MPRSDFHDRRRGAEGNQSRGPRLTTTALNQLPCPMDRQETLASSATQYLEQELDTWNMQSSLHDPAIQTPCLCDLVCDTANAPNHSLLPELPPTDRKRGKKSPSSKMHYNVERLHRKNNRRLMEAKKEQGGKGVEQKPKQKQTKCNSRSKQHAPRTVTAQSRCQSLTASNAVFGPTSTPTRTRPHRPSTPRRLPSTRPPHPGGGCGGPCGP